MWFNNAQFFQYELEKPVDLQIALAEERLKPCPPHARFIYGWLPVTGEDLIQEVAGGSLICLGKEERILPRGVIKRILAERVQVWETQHGRSMKRAEKAQMAEELEFELLPKSFCLQKRLFALFDTAAQRLIVNTSSSNQALQLVSLLRKSIPGIRIDPIEYEENLSIKFAHWLNDATTLPEVFQLASDCLLFALDDEKKRFNCKGYELPSEEITTLISQGLAAAEISLIWNERIQFTLTQDLTLKRIKCLEYLVDEFQEIRELEEERQQQDAALTLLAGELHALLNDVFKALVNKEKTTDHIVPGIELAL
ncbi:MULTISPECIES: recombination-associated protein RdgC [Legionella]|uniref:Recombination-associated protein RdgC n=1 Tax=Legionella septentrionalis TaxID=2498109 RepID=A0A433JJK7_9GAMM|nr:MULTISPECIES: recombination-associated protein RdgC [Legionella]MCP0913337.1 recombination-associated protein RdgC [Legionella sp. 27cVA30]RUQ88381.1 recombination-associated protein RdgC [Legionella septentrionalis]RUQ93068.1 recombination-associated protein RdgC [Legionella septentrionalis]RUR09487.1 recombination-associated protein RdgC [Legionella septentrionalis]RUR13246.1 recombination-associated protein RdgC [Legionella septentrionalis]